MSRHHNIAKFAGGANHPDNYTEIERELHRRLHMLFQTMPPHIQLKYLMKISGVCIKEGVKADVLSLLEIEKPEELYKPKTIDNIGKFKKACNSALWIDYLKV